VKREKGIEATKDHKVFPNGQFKLSNFEVGCQNKKIVTSSVEEPKQSSQNVMPIEALEAKANDKVQIIRQHYKPLMSQEQGY